MSIQEATTHSDAYDGYERTSFYVPVRDGVKLAMDLFRPTRGGEFPVEKLPVVWMHTPYNRRHYAGGETVKRYPGQAIKLVPFGYNVAVVDFRGLYASYGRNGAYNRGEWLDSARFDAYDITEWFAAQPWSNAAIGMWGCSATGGSQMQAATTAPPSLRAIFPMSCEFDAYPFGVPGGSALAEGVPMRLQPGGSPEARDKTAVAVDGPEGPVLLAEAIAQHKDNIETAGRVPFRDSVSPSLHVRWWEQSSPHAQLDVIKRAGIGVYAAANWDEAATKYGAFFTFKNLGGQAKLIAGPGTHCNWSDVKLTTGFDIATEERRFFDYWLKGLENGLMDEPPVTYFTYNAPEGQAWRHAVTWPLPSEQRTGFHLGAGALDRAGPTATESDRVAINARFGPGGTTTTTSELSTNQKSLTYVTPALAEDVEVTGHPVARLWITSSAADVDVIAYLDDLAPDGTATAYNMHGQLRASGRKLAEPPFDNLGLPWHAHREADATPLAPDEPAELVLDLLPISYIFKAGHKIRLRLVFADPSGRETAGAISVLRAPEYPSRLILPIIPIV